jgi:mono/diheme cytochrome c family protein
MRFKIAVVAVLLVLGIVLALSVAARPKVDQVTALVAVSEDGAALYAVYCTSCHGAQGRGDGKAVPFLRLAVPDLTRIAERAGKFDSEAVLRTITGEDRPAYHEMPGWDAVFASAYATPERERVALNNLVRHLEKMQSGR